jgi:hypothetical protein
VKSLPQREHALFPGAVILALATLGLFAPVYPRRRRIALALTVLIVAGLSLGYDPDRHLPIQPYKVIHDYLPGWNGIRVPSRLNTLTSLGLALLAAAGAQFVSCYLGRQAARRNLRSGLVAGSAGAVLLVAVLVEGSGFQIRGGLRSPPEPHVPPIPSGQVGVPGPQIHLPVLIRRPFGSEPYMLWSTRDFPEIANGWGAFVPLSAVRFTRYARSFPNAASVARLRSMGIRTVILHPDLATRTAWEGAAERPVRGLPLRREVAGDVVVYHLKPI